MKNMILPLLLLLISVQSFGISQQDSLQIKITDEYHNPVAGVYVIERPHSYLLGTTDERGEVLLSDLKDNTNVIFQCLGFQVKSVLYKELKKDRIVILQEKITELSEATVKAIPMDQLLSTVSKQLSKKYKAKHWTVRYYTDGFYSKAVECKGKTVHLRHEHGLYMTSGDVYQKEKWDLPYQASFIPVDIARSFDLTCDGRDTLKRLKILLRTQPDKSYSAPNVKIFTIMRSVYLYAPLFNPVKNFNFKLVDIDSINYTLEFATKLEKFPDKVRALSRGHLKIDKQTLALKSMYFDYFDYYMYELKRAQPEKAAYVTQVDVEFKYDTENHAYISQCSSETFWKYVPRQNNRIFSIEKPSRPSAAKNQLIEKEKWTCNEYKPIPAQYQTTTTSVQANWAELCIGSYNREFFSKHPNPFATLKAMEDLNHYKDLEKQYEQNNNKLYTEYNEIDPQSIKKSMQARKILLNLFYKTK